MPLTRFLLFIVFGLGLIHILLYVSKDPGLSSIALQQEFEEKLGFVSLSVGNQHACAVGEAGGAWCWGAGEFGQLGHGRFASSQTPVPVIGLTERVSQVAVGWNTSCALGLSGRVWCWGSSGEGQIGLPDNTPLSAYPIEIKNLKKASSLAVGAYHACAILQEGGVSCWGTMQEEKDGQVFLITHKTPKTINNKTAFKSIKATDLHTCGIDENNDLLCWGSSRGGSMGIITDETKKVENTPTPISIPEPVKDFAIGPFHGCTSSLSKQVYCWGEKQGFEKNGQEGIINAKHIKDIENENGLALVDGALCMLSSSGRINCQGKHDKNTWSPVFSSTQHWVSLDAQRSHICALSDKKSVSCGIISPGTDMTIMKDATPSSWVLDNSLTARWERAVGLWARKEIPHQE